MKHLMRDTILVYPTPNKDAYGRDSFSAYTTYRGRFVYKVTTVIDSKGEEVQADGICYLPTEVSELDIGDKISYVNINYRVISIEKPKDSTCREIYIKVTVKRTI
jgi:hypothetical protein